MVELTRTKSTRVTKFLKKLAKDGASSRIRVKYGSRNAQSASETSLG